MVKVFIIIGLFLVIAGVPGLFWCSFQGDQQQQQIAVCKAKYKHQVDEYVQKLTGSSLKATDAKAIDLAAAAPNPEKMKPVERLQYQQERLFADIDELAEANLPIPPNADVVYGDQWRQKVDEYKKKKQSRAAIQVASVTGIIAGGVLFVAAIVFAFFRIMADGVGWVVRGFRKKDKDDIPVHLSRQIPQDRIEPPQAIAANASSPAAKSSGPTAEEFRKQLVAQTENLKETVDRLKTLAGDLEKRAAEHDNNLAKHLEKGFKIQHAGFKHENDLLKKSQEMAINAHEDMVRMFSDGINAIRGQIEELNTAVAASTTRQAAPADISAQLAEAFSRQAELLKNEIEPLKNTIAETLNAASQAAPGGVPVASESIGKNLADLTEQVCAIREYAAKQQQRLAKLQDGYDWNIIKNFCLRVIRCIDNLDDRIGELSANGGSVDHLSPVREELVFILESNGIERFGAKVNSDYRGQEIRVQVLNEREETEEAELIGKIAHVVRPGYQCRVNDEYTKIVRPAQVRLYGSPCLSDVAVRGS